MQTYVNLIPANHNTRGRARPRETHEVKTSDIAGKQGGSDLETKYLSKLFKL